MSLINCVTFEPYNSSYNPGKHLSINKETNRIILTPEEFTETHVFLRNILSQKHEIKFGKKVYLGTASNLPRHRVKEYFDNNNIKKTSRIEQANTVIIDKNSINDLYNYIKLDTSHKINKYSTYVITDPDKKREINSISHASYGYEIPKSPSTPYYILFSNNSPSSILKSCLRDLEPQILCITNSWSKDIDIKNTYKIIEFLRKNPSINIILDEDILPVINNNGFDLDPAYLDTLDSMFESKTQENIDLALEMLSNVDLEKHALTLALFLNKHMDKFFKGSNLNIHQNRSFKSFIKYFDSKKIPFRSNWKEFSASLLREYKNDPEKVEIINNFILQNINNFLRTVGEKKLPNWIEIENCNIKLK